MLEVIFLLTIGLIWIIFATVQDIKEKEVANWLNFSLIVFALGFRFFFSLFSQQGFAFFYQGLIGLGIFFILGNIFYYSRIFAGGDAKLMIALGTILPLSSNFFNNLNNYLLFLVLFFIIGTVYGLVWSFILVIRNFKPFKKEFLKIFRENKTNFSLMMFFGLIIMILGFYQILLFYLGLLFFISPYFFVFAKAVDEAAMIRKVNVKDLREGDWLYKDVKVGRKYIEATWDGLNNKEIALIRKKYKIITIRQGIAFVPVFFFTYVIFIYGILRGISIFSFI
jgi:Flp pilus assembly protein protease CpaA